MNKIVNFLGTGEVQYIFTTYLLCYVSWAMWDILIFFICIVALVCVIIHFASKSVLVNLAACTLKFFFVRYFPFLLCGTPISFLFWQPCLLILQAMHFNQNQHNQFQCSKNQCFYLWSWEILAATTILW